MNCNTVNTIINYTGNLSSAATTKTTRVPLATRKSFPDTNNNTSLLQQSLQQQSNLCSIRGDKYSLRPRSLRKEDDSEPVRHLTSKPSHKPKPKPAPLSKYRRKTANARERSRMREINVAFEALRSAVPHLFAAQAQCAGTSSNEKLTKITTLRLAMRYISALSSALQNNNESTGEPMPFGSANSDDIGDFSELDFLLESDGESVPLSDGSITLSEHSLLASPDYSDPTLSPVDFNDASLPSLFTTDFDNPTSHCTEFSDPNNSFANMELSDYFLT